MEGMGVVRGLTAAYCLVLVASCSAGGEAARPSASPAPAPVPAATAVAPSGPPDRDGLAGMGPPSVCGAVDLAALAPGLGGTLTARPYSWNDGGVPSLDVCAIVQTRTGTARTTSTRTLEVGVSVLPAQPTSVPRLAGTLGSPPQPAPDIGYDAQLGRQGIAFVAGGRAVRITADDDLTRAEAAALTGAVAPLVAKVARTRWLTDATCQPSGAVAEQFLGGPASLRRDYRVRGTLTCIWGTETRTVAIVESAIRTANPIPEARRDPRPAPAPIGQKGYYLPAEGLLVFKQGPSVVRVSALSDPPAPVPLDRLIDLVQPIMPLFIR